MTRAIYPQVAQPRIDRLLPAELELSRTLVRPAPRFPRQCPLRSSPFPRSASPGRPCPTWRRVMANRGNGRSDTRLRFAPESIRLTESDAVVPRGLECEPQVAGLEDRRRLRPSRPGAKRRRGSRRPRSRSRISWLPLSCSRLRERSSLSMLTKPRPVFNRPASDRASARRPPRAPRPSAPAPASTTGPTTTSRRPPSRSPHCPPCRERSRGKRPGALWFGRRTGL